MKRTLTALLLSLVLSGVGASAIRPPQNGFENQLWGSTLALYGTKGDMVRFLCTAEPIKKTPSGYQVLSAGHCVQDVPADVQFTVADEIGGPRTSVTVIKAYEGDGLDFALFDLVTTHNYSVFEIGTDEDVAVGDQVINPNFAAGLGKQLSHGQVASRILNGDGVFMVQVDGAPGSSGSAVLSAKTHKVIGVLILGFNSNGFLGFGAEPISLLQRFLASPGQPHPVPVPEDAE